MEGNKKFINKRNRDNSKNISRSLNRNFSKSKDFSQKKNGFGLNFQKFDKFSNKKSNNNFEKNSENFDDDFGYNENKFQSNKKADVIKIAKYWEPMKIIEPVNTQGKIAISDENNYLFSIVGNELKILDLNTYAVIKSFNLVCL
jgi:tRNA nucleotidyltransferase/poly(A) polymerase